MSAHIREVEVSCDHKGCNHFLAGQASARWVRQNAEREGWSCRYEWQANGFVDLCPEHAHEQMRGTP